MQREKKREGIAGSCRTSRSFITGKRQKEMEIERKRERED